MTLPPPSLLPSHSALSSSAKPKRTAERHVKFWLPDEAVKRQIGLYSSWPVKELIPQRLYFTVFDGPPITDPTARRKPILLNIDNELVYNRFYKDFGPLNLAQITTYLLELRSLLESGAREDRLVVHYCSSHPEKRIDCDAPFNDLLLDQLSPAEALDRLESGYPSVMPFRDASIGDCPYPCTILDCLCGLQYAYLLGWYDPCRFDINEYNYYASLQNGDLNWIIPRKILAFSSPQNERRDNRGFPAHIPEDFHAVFKSMGVELIVRLNDKLYDRNRFTSAGFAHMDLYFPDGTCPSPSIMSHFFNAVESIPSGVIAVHCKAGLGRTGCLIGLYAMKRYGFRARAWIGWNRICRPGSILGHQQQFLCDVEHAMRTPQLNKAPTLLTTIDPDRYGVDIGQGERLMAAKQKTEMTRLGANKNSISAMLRLSAGSY